MYEFNQWFSKWPKHLIVVNNTFRLQHPPNTPIYVTNLKQEVKKKISQGTNEKYEIKALVTVKIILPVSYSNDFAKTTSYCNLFLWLFLYHSKKYSDHIVLLITFYIRFWLMVHKLWINRAKFWNRYSDVQRLWYSLLKRLNSLNLESSYIFAAELKIIHSRRFKSSVSNFSFFILVFLF